jgi:hypothetical protein
VINLGLVDVLGRLRLVRKDDRWGSATYILHTTRMKAIGEVTKRLEDPRMLFSIILLNQVGLTMTEWRPIICIIQIVLSMWISFRTLNEL